MMMRGCKDEEKIMGPLFPRLRINDAEKGGPRAPPRNKMALYEQLGIPSQKFTSGSASTVPLPPNNSGSLVPSTSSSHAGGQKRSLCSPIYNSPASSHLAERLHSYSSSGMNLNTTSMNLEWLPMKPTNYHTLDTVGHMSMTTNCSFFPPQSISNSKTSSAMKLEEGDDFKVPTFVRLGRTLSCGNGQQNADKEKLTASIPNGQRQLACVKQLKPTIPADLMSRQCSTNQTDSNLKMSLSCQDHAKKTNGDKVLADATSSPLARNGISESVKGALEPLNEEKKNSLMDDSNRLHDSNTELDRKYRASQEKKALRDGVSVEHKKVVGKKRDASMLEGVSCSRPSPGDNHRSPKRLENFNDCHEDHYGHLQIREADRNGDISENSIVDSTSGVDISPDDVVAVIGQKQFWKARRVIVHQQRVFAVQVFELHRLIKVQRMIAASPDLLLKNKLYPGNPSIQALPVKKFPYENLLEAPNLFVKLKDDPQKPCEAENNALGKPPLPSLNSDTNKELDTQQLNYKSYPATPPPPPALPSATDAKPAPWCFHPPPGNQWLVPVMSPSEGLVYKPYSGPCPPSSGFMAPFYGNCGPTNLTPVGRDSLNTTYAIPGSHQGIGIFPGTPPLSQTYFGPYGMPLMSPSACSSAVEETSPFGKAQSNGQVTVDINFSMPCQSSFNMSSPKSGAKSYCVKNLQALKENEGHGSTASSPERVQVDALPLFPTAPTVLHHPAQSHSSEQRTRVIKVVPHNPRSASESAARIFQSIQEERRRYD